MKNDGYGDNIKQRSKKEGGLVLRKVRSGINGKVIAVGLEDGLHAKLRDSLIAAGVHDAALSLKAGFDALAGEVGFKISNPESLGRCTKSGNMSQGGAARYADYCKWYKECERLKLSPKLCVNVICHEYSVRAMDKEYHFASGTTMKAVIRCLEVYQSI